LTDGKTKPIYSKTLGRCVAVFVVFSLQKWSILLKSYMYFVHKDTHCYCGPLRPIKLHLPKDDLNLNMTLI